MSSVRRDRMRRVDSLEKTLMLGGIGGRRRRDNRGWDGWMASLNRWTWVWVNSGSWWWTGRPGVLQFMGSQRIGHDWAELISSLHSLILLVTSARQAEIDGARWKFCSEVYPLQYPSVKWNHLQSHGFIRWFSKPLSSGGFHQMSPPSEWHLMLSEIAEFHKNIYFCFIDYAKAFDCVDHSKLRKFLKRWEYQITLPVS